MAKAKDKHVPVKSDAHVMTIYFNNTDIRNRMKALEKKTGVSISKQIAVTLRACIGTLEAEMPNKRVFKMNDVEVSV